MVQSADEEEKYVQSNARGTLMNLPILRSIDASLDYSVQDIENTAGGPTTDKVNLLMGKMRLPQLVVTWY